MLVRAQPPTGAIEVFNGALNNDALQGEAATHPMIKRRQEGECNGVLPGRTLRSTWHWQRSGYHGGPGGLGKFGERTSGFAVDDANREPYAGKRIAIEEQDRSILY